MVAFKLLMLLCHLIMINLSYSLERLKLNLPSLNALEGLIF